MSSSEALNGIISGEAAIEEVMNSFLMVEEGFVSVETSACAAHSREDENSFLKSSFFASFFCWRESSRVVEGLSFSVGVVCFSDVSNCLVFAFMLFE